MKLLISLVLTSCLTTALANENDNKPPSMDHSTIFNHSSQSTPDIKSMRKAEVINVLNTKGYTYIKVNKEDLPIWLAVPTTEVDVGDTVHYTDGPVVQNHHSRTLDRKFDAVIFLLSVVVNNEI